MIEPHSNAPEMPAGFAGLQAIESRLVQAALAPMQAGWVLEVAPTASASPELEIRRCRVLVDGQCCRWPFISPLDEWPLDDRSVPAIVLRHVWQPAVERDPLDEALRVLKPGGVLVSVSANPWHRIAWQELGRSALALPSWPQFQLIHARRHFQLSVPARSQVRGFVPGLTPVLVLVARKPAEPARIEPVRFREPQAIGGTPVPTQCRAA